MLTVWCHYIGQHVYVMYSATLQNYTSLKNAYCMNMHLCKECIKEATRIKRNVYFLDLVDLDLTYLGWYFKVIPFLTDYDHQGALIRPFYISAHISK